MLDPVTFLLDFYILNLSTSLIVQILLNLSCLKVYIIVTVASARRGGEDIGCQEVTCPAHHWNLDSDIELVYVVRSVRLAEHAMHVGAERVKFEGQIEVDQVVVGGHVIIVDP